MAGTMLRTTAGWLLVLLVVDAMAPGETGAADAPTSPAQCAERIRKYRTTEATVTVLDATGKPLANLKVAVQQVRHKFLFGCNAFGVNTADTSADQENDRKHFAGLLNYATLPFYWGAFEPVEGKTGTERIRSIAEWCKAHGIRTKGHPLCWHQVPPKWLETKTLDEVRLLQLGRITRDVKSFAGLIDTWDVVNEAVVMPGFQPDKNRIAQLCKEVGVVELIKQTFAAARGTNATATLLLNDYDTSAKYEALIQDCLAAGVTIDVVGIQSHMHGGYRGGAWAWSVCERFSRFGKPLHFTETTIQSGEEKKKIDWNGHYNDWLSTPEGEKRQSEQVTDFYRVLFSHPAVEGISWWDFADKNAWLGAPAGLLRKDMSPKPAYEALLKLVKGEWWTAPQTLTTDAGGKISFRGFLGAYTLESSAGKGAFQLTEAGKTTVTTTVGASK